VNAVDEVNGDAIFRGERRFGWLVESWSRAHSKNKSSSDVDGDPSAVVLVARLAPAALASFL
tara:strand:- start:435 stop:620 length:186 start_codon:yes stop_codon:yes gene_type:complete